jgi:hypothetical protein
MCHLLRHLLQVFHWPEFQAFLIKGEFSDFKNPTFLYLSPFNVTPWRRILTVPGLKPGSPPKLLPEEANRKPDPNTARFDCGSRAIL